MDPRQPDEEERLAAEGKLGPDNEITRKKAYEKAIALANAENERNVVIQGIFEAIKKSDKEFAMRWSEFIASLDKLKQFFSGLQDYNEQQKTQKDPQHLVELQQKIFDTLVADLNILMEMINKCILELNHQIELYDKAIQAVQQLYQQNVAIIINQIQKQINQIPHQDFKQVVQSYLDLEFEKLRLGEISPTEFMAQFDNIMNQAKKFHFAQSDLKENSFDRVSSEHRITDMVCAMTTATHRDPDITESAIQGDKLLIIDRDLRNARAIRVMERDQQMALLDGLKKIGLDLRPGDHLAAIREVVDEAKSSSLYVDERRLGDALAIAGKILSEGVAVIQSQVEIVEKSSLEVTGTLEKTQEKLAVITSPDKVADKPKGGKARNKFKMEMDAANEDELKRDNENKDDRAPSRPRHS